MDKFGKDKGIIAKDELRRFISAELIRIGFVPSLKGFRYFKELVLIFLIHREPLKLMKMYESVAESFGTKTEGLERNVRTLVSTSFYNLDGFRNLYEYFGITSYNRPPTSGQMLALVSEYITFRLFEENIHGIDPEE